MNSRVSNRYLSHLRGMLNHNNAKVFGQQPQTAVACCLFSRDVKSRSVVLKAKTTTAKLHLNEVDYPILAKMSKLSKPTSSLGCVCGLKAMPQLFDSMQIGQYQQQRCLAAAANDNIGKKKCESRADADGITSLAQPNLEDQVHTVWRAIDGSYSQNVIDEDDDCFWSAENMYSSENMEKNTATTKDNPENSEMITWKWK